MPQPIAFEDARIAIQSFVHTGWVTTLGNPAPLAWENQRFDETEVKDTEWGRVVILENQGDGPGFSPQVSLGDTPCYRYLGQVVGQFQQREKTGTSEIRQLVDQFLGLFLSATGKPLSTSSGDSGVIRFESGWAVVDGITEGWYQMRAIVPFKRDVQGS